MNWAGAQNRLENGLTVSSRWGSGPPSAATLTYERTENMGKKTDSLGDRMKCYEGVPRHFLTRRVPVIIRIDGKAFHTFTRGFDKPFDAILMNAMQSTMQYLCENIQGCVFGYTQSDEITLVLTDYAKLTTDAWFGYNVQKMTSIAASMATFAFNRAFQELAYAFMLNCNGHCEEGSTEFTLCKAYSRAINRGAMFDARVFSVPKDEVCNCLIWRQQDAVRNSIEGVGQAYFSANELHKKSTNMIQEMLFQTHGINWNDFPVECKRGSCCYRVPVTETIDVPNKEPVTVTRNKWRIDHEIPTFTQDREFVEKWL